MADKVTLFFDRDGDSLSVTPRNIEGDGSWDPIITVTHGNKSQSVVLQEEQVVDIVVSMALALNLTDNQLEKISFAIDSLLIERGATLGQTIPNSK